MSLNCCELTVPVPSFLLVGNMAQALASLITGSCRHQGCFCGGSRTVGDENALCSLESCRHRLGEHNPLQSGSLFFVRIFPAFFVEFVFFLLFPHPCL